MICVRLQLAVEQTADFGVTVIGETLRRWVHMRNAGALGTAFTFTKLPLASATSRGAANSAGGGARPPHSALAKAGEHSARGGSGGASARSQRSVRIRDDAHAGVSLLPTTQFKSTFSME